MSDHAETLSFVADDGYRLTAYRYRAEAPEGVIIVAGATGVPQGFYRQFALYASLGGYDVVTFDYRGIGQSAPATLKGFDVDFRDWARKDLKALVDLISTENLPAYIVGHSYGGHALGLMDNHHLIDAAYFLGVGAGWHGWMPMAERMRVLFMWHVMAPAITRIQGYLGWSLLGMGEDLPLGVYRQWKRWCQFPNYFFGDSAFPEVSLSFNRVRMPIKAVNAIDDKWAMPASRDAFVRYYSNSELLFHDLHPGSLGLKKVGHMGYFRRGSEGVWSDILTYFGEVRSSGRSTLALSQ